jgi:hypothetical protein
MAVPFYIPQEEEEDGKSIPIGSSQLQVDNDVIVQALFEALSRCSQIPSPSTTSPLNQVENFWFSSPSTSTISTLRGSLRRASRRRLSSYGSQSQYSEESIVEYNEDEIIKSVQQDNLEELSKQISHHSKNKIQALKSSKKLKKRSNKITKIVISALKFVIKSFK